MQADMGRKFFAEEFERVLVDTDTSVGRLARLSGIPRRTLENWLYGNTLHPRHVESILQIARVLHLPENDTDRLLLSAGHPSLSDLKQREQPLPAELLRNWQLTSQFSRDNIPAVAAPLIGREQELDAIGKMLDDPDIRLVTITGLGGIGKTRLAQEVAWQQTAGQFQDGVTYVSLAALESADHLIPAIAEGLHLPIQDAHDPRKRLLAYLSRKRMLLVCDNFEHLLAGVDLINEIRGAARDVKLLFTSREPLNVAGEALFPVGGLTYPEDEKKLPADGGDFGAVKLLLYQARLIHPQQELEAEDMEAIGLICQLVQGMPLAIILAAGWLEILSPGEIAGEIGRGLDLLESEARDKPDRQRSVRAAFDYSWNRLSSAEQDSFMKLAVFRGGFTRQAAGSITGADLHRLRRFADISLIDTVGPNRYTIHELLRQFAAEKLEERGITAATREAHSAYYLKALARREADLRGSKLAQALDESERDFENSRRAWNWAIDRENETQLDHALESLYLYCFLRSRFQEGAELLCKAAGLYADDSLFKGRVLSRLAFIRALFARELQEIIPDAHEGLEIAQRHDNQPAIAFAHFAIGFCHHFLQDHAAAIPHYEQSLQRFRELGDRYYTARVLHRLGDCYAAEIGTARSMEMTREALELALEIDAFFDACVALKNLGILSTLVGNFAKGEQLEREGVNLALELGFPHVMANTSVHLGLARFLSGDVDQATQLVRRGLALGADLDVQKIVADGQAVLALLDVAAGNYEQAQRLALQSEGRTSIPDGVILPDWALAMVYAGLDQLQKAGRHLCQAFDAALFYGWPGAMTWLLPVAVVLLAKAGQRERAVEVAALSSSQELSRKGWKERWELYGQVNDELARELDPAPYLAARARGTALDVKETAVQLIKDLAETEVA